LQGVSDFVDGSGHIFSMYLEMATEEDKKMVEGWKADADGILIFVRLYNLILCPNLTRWSQTGLFSAAVASLISVSIQDIQENPQDTSNFYLANIYQAAINPNGYNNSSSPPASPPPFSPPNSAVWVNALWFLSLVISLTCALLATLLQQWARRYLKMTQSRHSPHKRARIRAFFSEGVEKCLLPWTVETLPTLLHISLFLFFAGLVVFLCNVNLTIFKLVLSWVGLCTALYGCITCMPIFRHDSPYYTPLSLPAWHIVTRTLFFVYRFLKWFNWSVCFRQRAFRRFKRLEETCRRSLVQGMQKTAEETALNSPSEIVSRAFMWTLDCLDEDHELERFFSGLPSFRSSNVVRDPLPSLTEEEKRKLSGALKGLLDRTFSTDLLPAPVKYRRAMICTKAGDPEYIPDAFNIFIRILFEYQNRGPLATGIAKTLRGWGNNVGETNIVSARFAISNVIATRQPHDDSWYTLASNELGFSEAFLRDYAAQGDSLSLVILIHVVRQQFIHFRTPSWPGGTFSFVLEKASKFNARDTSPELQHEFCALWNQIVHETQDGEDSGLAFYTLGRIRNVYLALHQGTVSAPSCFSSSTGGYDRILSDPTSYPMCKVPGHHPESTSPIHGDNASTTFTPAVPDDHDKISLVLSLPSPDPPPSSTHSSLPIDETLTDANTISLPVRTTPEDSRIPSSPTLVASCAIRGSIGTYPRAMNLSTLEPSVSTPPPKSTPPPDAVLVKHTVGHTTFGDPNVPSSASPAPFLDDILLPGRLLPSDSKRRLELTSYFLARTSSVYVGSRI
jgi:hypothetical protein